MRWLVGACLFLCACHLADSPDAPPCPSGTHPNSGQCALDAFEGTLVTIASCIVTPDTIHVAANGEFRFKNDDAVDRTITGDDGTAWATAKAHQQSPVIGITKAGTWRYHVSDCASGGAVVVE